MLLISCVSMMQACAIERASAIFGLDFGEFFRRTLHAGTLLELDVIRACKLLIDAFAHRIGVEVGLGGSHL